MTITMIDFLLRKLVLSKTVFAQEFGGLGTSGNLPNPTNVSTIEALLNTIVTYLLQISIPIVAIMVIIGGFQMMFAGGNPEKITTGKKTILYSVIGYVIILLATGVIALIKQLLNTP